MKTTKKVFLGFSGVLILGLVLLMRHLLDLGDQYSALTYFRASLSQKFANDEPKAPFAVKDDKVVVMAKMESEDTGWVTSEVLSWRQAIYVVNPSTPPSSNTTLTTPVNKGHEAMAYLTYIIDNYENLPSTIAFIHPHESGFLSAWHTDTPLHSNADALNSLDIPYVQEQGYVNLRCNWNPGCLDKHRRNAHITPKIWRELFDNTTGVKDSDGRNPPLIGAACCAQFAVSRSRVQERPLSDYEHFRQWIIDTALTDAKSGRVFEFLWHIIFGMEAVHCPDMKTCYCRVYGRCS